MRIKWLVLPVMLLLASLAQAQNYTASLTASDTGSCNTANACLSVAIGSSGSATLTLAGTFSGTFQFEGLTGGTWGSLSVTPLAGGTAVTSATAAGQWQVNVAAVQGIRIRCSTYASGTATSSIFISSISARTGGSGGGAPSGPAGGALSGTYPNPTAGTPIAPNQGVFYVSTNCGTQTNCFTATGDDSADNATVFVSLATAVNAYTGSGNIDAARIEIAGGAAGTSATYKYASGLNFTRPVTIECQRGAVLDYSGSAHAIDLGTLGGAFTALAGASRYAVTGCGFIGGASMTQGIYVVGAQAAGVEFARITQNQFYNFGNGTAYGIYFNGEVDDENVANNVFINDDNTARNQVWSVGSSDSQLHLRDNSWLNYNFAAGGPNYAATAFGIPVWVGGAGSEISGNNFGFCQPCIRIDSQGADVRIINNYAESSQGTSSTNGIIQYGNPSTGGTVSGLVVDGFYVNVHGQTTPLAPATAAALLVNSKISNVFVQGFLAPVVRMNNLAAQTGNEFSHIVNQSSGAVLSQGANLATQGSNLIATWAGVAPDTSNFGSQLALGVTGTTNNGIAFFVRNVTAGANSQIYLSEPGDSAFGAGHGAQWFAASTSSGLIDYEKRPIVFYTAPVTAGTVVQAAEIMPQGGIEDTATVFGASGCSISAHSGGAAVGQYTSGTTGTCTVVITPGSTAAHGWVCRANDLTTPADTQNQSASSTTTCTISGTTVSGDVVNFLAMAY